MNTLKTKPQIKIKQNHAPHTKELCNDSCDIVMWCK